MNNRMRGGYNRFVFVRVAISCSFVAFVLSLSALARSENDFFRELLKKPVATNVDAIRAVARFRGYRGSDNAQAEIDYVRNQGIKIRQKILKTPRAPVTKGDASNLFLNAMRSSADQRGLFGRIFSGSRRFAARDAMAQKILPQDSFMNEFMSGAELYAMLGRAVEQTEKKP